MRTLNGTELEHVSGGDWELGFDIKIIHGEVSGDESIQEIAAAASGAISGAYWDARDAMADFYEWAAAGWNFAMGCGY